MIASFLLLTASPLLSAPINRVITQESEPQPGPALYVLEDEQLEWAADLVAGENWVLLPMMTHSDRSPRAVPGARGFELRIACDQGVSLDLHSLRLHAIEHDEDERLLRCGEELLSISNVSLPAFVRRESDGVDRLPELARLDLQATSGETLRVAAGAKGSDLILLPRESAAKDLWRVEARSGDGDWGTLSGIRATGHAIRLDGQESWELRVAEDAIDRLFHGQTRLIPHNSETPLNPTGWRSGQAEGFEFRPRRHLGPLRFHPRAELGSGDLIDAERLEAREDSVLHLGPLDFLDVEFDLPRESHEGSRFTLLARLHVEISSVPREASSKATDEIPSSLFRDVARRAGIEATHFEGPEEQRDIRPTMGPGAAWGDVDGDGLQDLYLVQGGGRAGCEKPRNRLLRNLGNGGFAPMPSAADTGAGMGALFFDLEGDGDLDLYVANYGSDALYRNDGKGNFEDVSAEHQLASSEWSAGVSAADYDGDGDLDLYVTAYLVYDPELMPDVPNLPGYSREDPIEMLPFAFPGARNSFLENQDGKLVDRTEDLGLADEQGRGMQPVFWDFDLDGDQDLYIANDVSMNVLLRNEGDGSFEDISFQTGMDDPRGGMGVTTGDVDLDGDLDLFLSNWQLEANALYRNNQIVGNRRKQHQGSFQDVTVHARLGRHGVGFTSWGGVFFDADNDLDLDLFVPNGYTSPDYESTDICVGQPNQFFLNDGRGRFEDASLQAGDDTLAPLASRAAALCDYDRDGRLDLFVTNNNGPYQLLHNEIENSGHWLGIELGGRGANSAAVGAMAMLEVGGLTLLREVQAGGGYLAGHAMELHFGLGEFTEIESLKIRWPSGAVSEHEVEGVDRWITIEEPAGE